MSVRFGISQNATDETRPGPRWKGKTVNRPLGNSSLVASALDARRNSLCCNRHESAGAVSLRVPHTPDTPENPARPPPGLLLPRRLLCGRYHSLGVLCGL